jgi:uncharacterized membrane protein YhiD involved in acid resistance
MSAGTIAITTGLGFLLIFVSGIWLGRAGRPLNVGISTVHKLISLAAAIFLLVTFYRAGQAAALDGGGLIAVVVTGSLFLGSGISGAILSTDRPMVAAVLRVHQVLPVLMVLSSAGTLFLLGSR